MAYSVYTVDSDELIESNWRNYIDVGLKYRWYAFSYPDGKTDWDFESLGFESNSEDIPVHPCGDFKEEGFDEPD